MYVNYFGWGMKELIPRNIYGTPIPYQFEDIFLYGVQNADSYLTQLYGNYNILPEESQRHVHASEMYYIEDLKE